MRPVALVRLLAASGCAGIEGDKFCTGLPGANANSANLQHVIQIVLGIVAVITVLIIVIAGLKFATAQSDPQKVTRARETIIYALVGLVVTTLAEVIVTFVLRGTAQ